MNTTHPSDRPLKVFLCHGAEDKPLIRSLHDRLLADGVEPWLDERNIVPGTDWNAAIKRAVRDSDTILVCLSTNSVGRAGYLQKEIRYALDVADEKPEGTIFIVPVKLDDCEIPERLRQWQWVQYSTTDGYDLILRALHIRAAQCGLQTPRIRASGVHDVSSPCVLSFEVEDRQSSVYFDIDRRNYVIYVDDQPFIEIRTQREGVRRRRPLSLGPHTVKVEYDEYQPYHHQPSSNPIPGHRGRSAQGCTPTENVDFKTGLYTIRLLETRTVGFWERFSLSSNDLVQNYRLQLDFEPFDG